MSEQAYPKPATANPKPEILKPETPNAGPGSASLESATCAPKALRSRHTSGVPACPGAFRVYITGVKVEVSSEWRMVLSACSERGWPASGAEWEDGSKRGLDDPASGLLLRRD